MTRRPVSERTFRRWVKECRAKFPVDLPVRVRRVRFPREPGTRRPTHVGECLIGETSIEIRVEETLDRFATADTLIHEWAHALRHEHDPIADHDDGFWVLFGTLYRTFYRTA